jgi:hypothetical protein
VCQSNMRGSCVCVCVHTEWNIRSEKKNAPATHPILLTQSADNQSCFMFHTPSCTLNLARVEKGQATIYARVKRRPACIENVCTWGRCVFLSTRVSVSIACKQARRCTNRRTSAMQKSNRTRRSCRQRVLRAHNRDECAQQKAMFCIQPATSLFANGGGATCRSKER